MAKGSGVTRSGSSRNPNGVNGVGNSVSSLSPQQKAEKIKEIDALKLGGQYGFGNITVGGNEYTIFKEPFGWDYSGKYRIINKTTNKTTFINWPNKRGASAKAIKEVKEWLKKRI